jgi:DNA polymerase-1
MDRAVGRSMTKSLSGVPLDLDDAPARGRDLLVIDGNNFAHRAFHALPEGIATSYGLPSNALLGFANLVFKLLCDVRPRGAVVAWDRKPTERLAAATGYKAGRKPMADTLAQQFPYFPEVIAGFGYPNVALDGWEADDVLATLATRAEAAGLTSCLVSTDRDAFQLVTEATCLMMTPRGVAAPQVYTPERLAARYGLTAAQIPDFIALKGDAADNIAPVPGIGEKTAAQLLVRYGTLDGIVAHAAELPPARRRAIEEHGEAARAARALATLRRDLPLPAEAEPTALVASRPDRSGFRAMLERFEMKRLLERAHVLDEAVPPAA